MNDTLISMLGQFGAAGLIGLLWLLERRHAATRDRQLSETHRAMLERERSLDALLEVVKDNTRAISAMQRSQDELVRLLDRLADVRLIGPVPTPPPGHRPAADDAVNERRAGGRTVPATTLRTSPHPDAPPAAAGVPTSRSAAFGAGTTGGAPAGRAAGRVGGAGSAAYRDP